MTATAADSIGKGKHAPVGVGPPAWEDPLGPYMLHHSRQYVVSVMNN